MAATPPSALEVAAWLFCQHPEVCKLQTLAKRIAWLAAYAKPAHTRPFKPSSPEVKALRTNRLVSVFDSVASNPDNLNKDQRHYVLLFAWQHDCLGRAHFAPDEALRRVHDEAKKQAAAVEKARADTEARKDAHDTALRRFQLLQQQRPPQAGPGPQLRKRRRVRTIWDSDDESSGDEDQEHKMLAGIVSVLEAKMASGTAGKPNASLMRRLQKLTSAATP